MNIRKRLPLSGEEGNSFFKNLNVSYWQGANYNDTNSDMLAEIDVNLGIPLVDEASNYVCAVERLELSGNNIAYYDASNDGILRPAVFLLNGVSDIIPILSWVIIGKFFSLPELIQYLNNYAAANFQINEQYIEFNLDAGGKINVNILDNVNINTTWNNHSLGFQGEQIASIFGLPAKPDTIYHNAQAWNTALNGSSLDPVYSFSTKTSRMDCGIIPSLILLRSNLPFESDQTETTKTNIVTDFSIAVSTSVSASYTPQHIVGTGVFNGIYNSYSITYNTGGMIVYIPQERRWLNFNAPIPIYNIRLWIDVIYNDSSNVRYYLPPGGTFRVKLGFYQRE